MANVLDYQVTELYGCQPGYPLNKNLCPPGQGFHNGIDYGCPSGTPVVVNGVQIALSGATGAVTGPHCHVGRYVGGKSTDPGVGNGFNFKSAVVYDSGYDDTDGYYVRITGDGALWNYLHLTEGSIKVKAGQVLQGGNMAAVEQISLPTARIMAYFMLGRNGLNGSPNALAGQSDDDISKGLVGQDFTQTFFRDIYQSAEAQNFIKTLNNMGQRIKDLEESEQKLAQDVVDRDKTIADLKAAGTGDKVQIGTINGKPVYGDK